MSLFLGGVRYTRYRDAIKDPLFVEQALKAELERYRLKLLERVKRRPSALLAIVRRSYPLKVWNKEESYE